MKNPFILVVVPFKDETNLVIDFVQSALNSYVSDFSWSLICWDDGSTESQIEYLYQSIPKEMMIVQNNNVGYTKAAFNIVEFAKKQTNYDHLLLVNSDVKFERYSMISLVKQSVSNPNTAAVGGKILNFNDTTIIHTGTRIENGKIVDPYCGLNTIDPKTNFVERRLWVNGCCTLYKLDILRREHLNFDLEFSPAYFEEADLMTKLNVMGYSVMYEPKAEIRHMVNGTMGKEHSKYEPIFWTNWNKYLEKWSYKFTSPELQF